MGSLLIYTSPAYFRCTGKEKENVRKGLPFPGPPSRKPAARRQEKQLYFGKGGRQPGPGRRPGARGRKRPRERRTPPPQPHTPAGRRAAEGPPQGAEGGAGCPRPSPARGGNVSGLKDAAAAPRPPPAHGATKGRAPSHRCPPSPIPPQVFAGSPRPPLPLARRWRRLLTRVPRSGRLGSGAAKDPENTGPLGRGGGGVALPPRPGPGSRLRLPRGSLEPPPRLPSGFPSRPPLVGRSCAKAASSAGAAARSSGPDHRQTPPPGAAGPRDARLAAPAPPLRRALAPFAGPFRGPGTRGRRTVGQPSPGFNSRRSRPPSGTCGSFAVSRVLEDPPPRSPALTLASPALFLCWIPPESQNNWVRASAKKEAEKGGREGAVRGDAEALLEGFPGEGQPIAR